MSSATLVLKVFNGDHCIATHRVSRDLVKIGRLETSHVRLDDESIARMHAVLEINGQEVRLVDLGSTTGSYVNGIPVERSAAVRVGDRIAVGPYTMLVDLERAEALARAPVAERPSPSPFVPLPDVELEAAAPVAEVVGTWQGAVRDVQHVGQAPARRTDASAWMALGGLLIAGGIGIFAHDVGQDWESYREQARVEADHGRPIPQEPGWGLAGLGLGLALFGLAPFTFGIVRRNERVRSDYVLGESHEASFPMSATTLAGSNAFTLVRRGDHGVSLRYTAAMQGELVTDGQRIDLREVTAAGRARFDGEAYELPLSAGARARIAVGEHEFHVRAVPPGRAIAARQEADKPFWIANAGALASIGSLILLTQLLPADALGMEIDDSLVDNRFVGYITQPDLAPEPEMDEEEVAPAEAAGGTNGARHVGDEGKMGDPRERATRKMYAMKGPKDAVPQLARNFDPDLKAREAGLLGMIQQDQGHFLASPYGEAFAVGNQDEDLWGNITGTELGAANGMEGLGNVGTGRGGGGQAEGVFGLASVGGIGTIGKNGGPGGYGHGSSAGFERRTKRVPSVRVAKTVLDGGIDKDIIRRVVRSHLMEVRGCYNQGLVRDPNLNGRVLVQFTIGPSGSVGAAAVAESSLKDAGTGQCIAKAVKRWRFPKPTTGGSTIVSYPFVLSPA